MRWSTRGRCLRCGGSNSASTPSTRDHNSSSARQTVPSGSAALAESPPAPAAEDVEFYGEFYPVAHPHSHNPPGPAKDFTLVELLVVLGVIAVVTSLLLPAL